MPRIIYTLAYTLDNGQAIQLDIDRKGMPVGYQEFDPYNAAGKPLWPKRRTIDLRVGDTMYLAPGWYRITRVVCVRDEFVDEVIGSEGFVVGARKSPAVRRG